MYKKITVQWWEGSSKVCKCAFTSAAESALALVAAIEMAEVCSERATASVLMSMTGVFFCRGSPSGAFFENCQLSAKLPAYTRMKVCKGHETRAMQGEERL